MKTSLLFVPFDAEKVLRPNLESDDFAPEYKRELQDGEEVPKPGDFLYYMIDGTLTVRHVVQRLFLYQIDGHDAVMLFVDSQ